MYVLLPCFTGVFLSFLAGGGGVAGTLPRADDLVRRLPSISGTVSIV